MKLREIDRLERALGFRLTPEQVIVISDRNWPEPTLRKWKKQSGKTTAAILWTIKHQRSFCIQGFIRQIEWGCKAPDPDLNSGSGKNDRAAQFCLQLYRTWMLCKRNHIPVCKLYLNEADQTYGREVIWKAD